MSTLAYPRSIDYVANRLSISRAEVYRLRESGKLPARWKLFESNRGWRWSDEDIDAYLFEHLAPRLELDDAAPPFVPISRLQIVAGGNGR